MITKKSMETVCDCMYKLFQHNSRIPSMSKCSWTFPKTKSQITLESIQKIKTLIQRLSVVVQRVNAASVLGGGRA